MQTSSTLLLSSIRNVGHFTVYAANMIHWALERGLSVCFLGYDFKNTYLFRNFSQNPSVQFIDITEVERRLLPEQEHLNDAAVLEFFFSEQGVDVQIEALAALQRELRPCATILLNFDDMLFNSDSFASEESLFPCPTYAVSTFGFKDFYMGIQDLYNERMTRILHTSQSLAGVLTLDENHVRAVDPTQKKLIFLPDPYRDFHQPPVDALPTQDREQLAELETFLKQGEGPVIPMIGKLDDRKNPLWILELADLTPAPLFVFLGERVPSADPAIDERMNERIQELTAQGRCFSRFTFTPEHFFGKVLECGRVPALPLAYSAHYGSSAIHLHALAHGAPTLTPDIGLMAFRTMRHGLGSVFTHNDKRDFIRAWQRMVQESPTPEQRARYRDFTQFFGESNLGSCLDYITKMSSSPPAMPPEGRRSAPRSGAEYFFCMQQGMQNAYSGQSQEAIFHFDQALAQRPAHQVILLRKGLAAGALGDSELFEDCISGLGKRATDGMEREYFAQLLAERGYRYYLSEERDPAFDVLDMALVLHPGMPEALHLQTMFFQRENRLEEALAPLTELTALEHPNRHYFLQTLGGVLAQLKRFDESAETFRTALRIAPHFLELWLNLSDVLRYARRLDEAWAALEQLQQIDARFPNLHLKQGQVLLAQGKAREALNALQAEEKHGEMSPLLRDCLQDARKLIAVSGQ